MCTNNSNCDSLDNECGCKTPTDKIVYQGPTLTCLGIENCNTVTEIIELLNTYLCSDELINTIIYNITNNIDIYQQFTTIVNNSVDCNTVWNCSTTTTTTTQFLPCSTYELIGNSHVSSIFAFVECGNTDVTVVSIGDVAEQYCIDNNYPIIQIGDGIKHNLGIACTTTTTTTI